MLDRWAQRFYIPSKFDILADLQCILLTAADAYMRDLHLHVPKDCLASIATDENDRALDYMIRNFDVDATPSTELDLAALRRADQRSG